MFVLILCAAMHSGTPQMGFTEKRERSIASFLFQLCRCSRRARGRFGKRGNFLFRSLNDDRRCRSPGIFAALFSHLGRQWSRGARVNDSFPRRQVCPPAITALTCRTQRRAFSKRERGRKYYWRSSCGAPRCFLIRPSDMRSDVFATKRAIPPEVFQQCAHF